MLDLLTISNQPINIHIDSIQAILQSTIEDTYAPCTALVMSSGILHYIPQTFDEIMELIHQTILSQEGI